MRMLTRPVPGKAPSKSMRKGKRERREIEAAKRGTKEGARRAIGPSPRVEDNGRGRGPRRRAHRGGEQNAAVREDLPWIGKDRKRSFGEL